MDQWESQEQGDIAFLKEFKVEGMIQDITVSVFLDQTAAKEKGLYAFIANWAEDKGKRAALAQGTPATAPLVNLSVTVMAVRNLPSGEVASKADPYVVLKHGTAVFKTKVVENAENAEIKENFTFSSVDPLTALKVEVMDHDTLSADDLIGTFCIPLHSLSLGKPSSAWYKLDAPAEKGEVQIRLQAQEVGKEMTTVSPSQDTQRVISGNRLVVTVVACRGLPSQDTIGRGDPYAVVRCGSETFKTQVITDSSNPKFNEKYTFLIPDSDVPNAQVNVEIMDFDAGSKDDLVGSVTIPVAGFPMGVLQEKSYPLENPARRGEVVIRMLAENFKPAPPKDGNSLVVHVFGVRNLPSLDAMSKSDPYVVLTIGDQTFKTKVVQDASESKFDEKFTFQVPLFQVPGTSIPRVCNASLKVEVMDQDVTSDELIGRVDVPLQKLVRGKLIDSWYNLQNNSNKQQGEVRLGIMAMDFGLTQ